MMPDLSLVPTADLIAALTSRYDIMCIVYGNDQDTGDEEATTEFRDKGSTFTLLGIASYLVTKYQRHAEEQTCPAKED